MSAKGTSPFDTLSSPIGTSSVHDVSVMPVTSGSQYADEAVRAGAAAIVAERKLDVKIPVFVVSNARRALAEIAANFYKHPAKELTLLGITWSDYWARKVPAIRVQEIDYTVRQ